MGEPLLNAYIATFEVAERQREFVVVGATLVEAAQAAQDAAASRGAGDAQVMALRSLRRLGAVLGGVSQKPEAQPPPQPAPEKDSAQTASPSSKSTKPARPAPRAPTRTDQLVAFLEGVGGRAHVTAIAHGLETSVKNGHNVVFSSLKTGRVERVGGHRGFVQLTGHISKDEPSKPRREWGGRVVLTHQAADAVHRLGGHAHFRQVAKEMGISEKRAASAVHRATAAGLLERVRRRPGGVVIPGQIPPEPGPTPSEKARRERKAAAAEARREERAASARIARREAHRVRQAERRARRAARAQDPPGEGEGIAEAGTPATSRGLAETSQPSTTAAPVPPSPRGRSQGHLLRARVYRTLKELGRPCSAKEIADQLGCRPREAGNAATVLVDGGVARRVGEDKPARFELAPES